MGCHIEIPQSRSWNGARVFACGEDINLSCKFCGEPGLYLCDWKEVERVEDTHWHEVRVGDVWALLPTKHGTVVEIESVEKGLVFHIDAGNGGIIRPFRFLNSTIPCPIFRRGTCDQPMCERHAREVGDDVHYCMDCWRRQFELIGGKGTPWSDSMRPGVPVTEHPESRS